MVGGQPSRRLTTFYIRGTRKGIVQVGELIDLLEQFRGRGETVDVACDELREYVKIVKVEWNDFYKTVVIRTELYE